MVRVAALKRRRSATAFLAAMVVGAVGCGNGVDTPSADGDAAAIPADRAPRSLSDPAPDADGVLRVLVYHDMEGLTGQSDPNTFRASHPDRYALGRQYLTGDVNAVVAGLFEGGADEVHIVDGHGSGSPDPDLLLDELDPRAELISRDEVFDAYVDLVEPDVYDAVAVVGMHAKTGSGGFASHTYTLGIGIEMNGASLTETEIVGYSWGRVGVPVIFASGDDRLAADLAGPMPWVRFVTVKTATSASTADPRPVDEARADLTSTATEAMAGWRDARAMRLSEPVRAALHAEPPASLAMMSAVPGVDYREGAVHFTAPDFRAAYDGAVGLVAVARQGYQTVMSETGRSLGGDGFGPAYSDALFDRWLDFESGRWNPPEPAPAAPRTYHGFR